jgi:general secretion pathway protein D
LKNAEAVKLAQTLRSILSSDSALPTSGSSASSANQSGGLNLNQAKDVSANNASSGLSLPGNSSSSNSQSSGAGGGFIQADAATNTLIITASEAVYKNLRGVIDQLDARRAQVYVEALIVEVSPKNTQDFGIQWMAATGDKNSDYRIGGGTSFDANGNGLFNLAAKNNATLGSALPTAGLTVGLFRQIGSQLGLGALAHAMASDINNNVLSIPTLLTLDNEEAKIVVGEDVPFLTGSFSQTGTAGANPFQTIERKEVGIKLTIKPQISEGGTVKLAIYQEVSKVTAPGASGPTVSKRSILTNVLVDDGDIIALGGLIDSSSTGGVEKIPLLGDIPLLGNLFKYQTKNLDKKNLMVFIRPTVIRNAEQANRVSLDRYDYLKAQYIQSTENGASDFPVKMDKGNLMSPTLNKSLEKVKSDCTEIK